MIVLDGVGVRLLLEYLYETVLEFLHPKHMPNIATLNSQASRTAI